MLRLTVWRTSTSGREFRGSHWYGDWELSCRECILLWSAIIQIGPGFFSCRPLVKEGTHGMLFLLPWSRRTNLAAEKAMLLPLLWHWWCIHHRIESLSHLKFRGRLQQLCVVFCFQQGVWGNLWWKQTPCTVYIRNHSQTSRSFWGEILNICISRQSMNIPVNKTLDLA